MKALSLWQPWATAMERGLKRNETRRTFWHLNCDVAICAARRPLDTIGLSVARDNNISLVGMKFGFVLCVVFMKSPIVSDNFTQDDLTQLERSLGDYSSCRNVYQTENLRVLREPVPVIGRQGIFNLPADVEAKVREQLTVK